MFHHACGCFCDCTNVSAGCQWKVAVSRRDLSWQHCPCREVCWCDAECWNQQNLVSVASVNRREMPMAGRAHLHPPAHRVDGHDQSCKRSWPMPEHRVQRGSGPTQDPYQAKQLQQAQEWWKCCVYFFTLIIFFNLIIGSSGKVKKYARFREIS